MHYEIRITEYSKRKRNGEIVKTTRNASIDSMSNMYQVAKQAIDAAYIQDGAHVRIARMSFDPTTDSFRIEEYEFNVYDRKAEGLKPVK